MGFNSGFKGLMSVLIWELDILVFDSCVLSLCSLYIHIYTCWGSNLGSSEWENTMQKFLFASLQNPYMLWELRGTAFGKTSSPVGSNVAKFKSLHVFLPQSRRHLTAAYIKRVTYCMKILSVQCCILSEVLFSFCLNCLNLICTNKRNIYSIHEFSVSHWGSFDWEGRGGCKGHRRGACKEEGLEEETGSSEGKNDEELDIAITNCWSTETSKKCQ